MFLLFPGIAQAGELGAIRVTSNLINSRVYLDGELRGTAPILLEAVPFGRHRVRLESVGCAPFVHQLDVTTGETVHLKALLQPDQQGIMILQPAAEEEIGATPVALTLAGGSRLDGGWTLVGFGGRLWEKPPFELLLRGGGMTGITFKVPYYGIYLEPSLLASRALRNGVRGLMGIGCRGSFINYDGLTELRNYLTGQLVLGLAFGPWFGEIRHGILRQQGDPTRSVEFGIGMVF